MIFIFRKTKNDSSQLIMSLIISYLCNHRVFYLENDRLYMLIVATKSIQLNNKREENEELKKGSFKFDFRNIREIF